MKWLSPLPEALKGINLQLQSIKFDSNRSEIRLEATSRDFQSFEQARTQLEQYFAVEQGQLNKNGEQVFGVFVVKQVRRNDERIIGSCAGLVAKCHPS